MAWVASAAPAPTRLARKAPLGQIWMAATLHAKINRKRVDKLDIIKIWRATNPTWFPLPDPLDLGDRGHLRRGHPPRRALRRLRPPHPAPLLPRRARRPQPRAGPRRHRQVQGRLRRSLGVRGEAGIISGEELDRGELERDVRPVCTHHLWRREAIQAAGEAHRGWGELALYRAAGSAIQWTRMVLNGTSFEGNSCRGISSAGAEARGRQRNPGALRLPAGLEQDLE